MFQIQLASTRIMSGTATFFCSSVASDLLYNRKKESFFKTTSNISQRGTITNIIPSKKPIGFQYKASAIFPCNNEIADRVEPQEGQGIWVTSLKMQTPNPSGSVSAPDR